MQGSKVFPRYTLTENDMNKQEKKEQFLELRMIVFQIVCLR